MIYPVYVPTKDLGVAKASGIVGEAVKDTDLVKIYFEGNLNNASNLNTYLDRVIVATGRLASNYPTVAFSVVKKESLHLVGHIDTDDYSLTLIKSKQMALNSYIGDLPVNESYHDHKVSIVPVNLKALTH